jgi:hypothetical protein
MLGFFFSALIVGFFVWAVMQHQRNQAEDLAGRSAFMERIKAAEAWALALESLPVVDVDVGLQKGEVAHAAVPCDWYEWRASTRAVAYHGPTASMQIVKGLRYRAGVIAPTAIRERELVRLDTGTLYVTNKRLVFDGESENKAIPWRSVLKVIPFSGGFEPEKQNGKSPQLVVGSEPERTAAVAARAFLESRE